MNYIAGGDRNQMQFFALEEMVTEDSWARIIDMFVDLLPLNDLGFKHASLKQEGRPRCQQQLQVMIVFLHRSLPMINETTAIYAPPDK